MPQSQPSTSGRKVSGSREGKTRRRPNSPKRKAKLLRASPRRRYRVGGVATAPDDDSSTPAIPTRWVKFVAAVLLLPWVLVYAQAFFNAFTESALRHSFWLTEEFWFFSLGCILWLITFFGLPRPVVFYVFGHELTHALWVWLMGGRVSKFKVGRDGGQIETDTSNFLIALAPYFFPVYSIAIIVAYGLAGLFFDLEPYRRLIFGLVGATWGFHATFTCWMIPKGQSDLDEHGHFFSLIVIFAMNLVVLTILFVAACPEVSWSTFGSGLLDQAITFSSWVTEATARFFMWN